jgi:hypothetical protein
MHADDRYKSFDLDAYLRGLLGSVVRFGAEAIHGASPQSKRRQYAGWGVSPMKEDLQTNLTWIK